MSALSPGERASFRKWWAITLGTTAETLAFAGIVFGLSGALSDSESAWFVALALGLAVVPLVFVILAFVSGNPRASISVLQAMGLFLVVGLVFSRLIDLVVGLPMAFGAGGVVALRPVEQSRRRRVVAVVLSGTLLMVVLLLAPPIGLAAAPIIPFVALGLADRGSAEKQPGGWTNPDSD